MRVVTSRRREAFKALPGGVFLRLPGDGGSAEARCRRGGTLLAGVAEADQQASRTLLVASGSLVVWLFVTTSHVDPLAAAAGSSSRGGLAFGEVSQAGSRGGSSGAGAEAAWRSEAEAAAVLELAVMAVAARVPRNMNSNWNAVV